MPTIEDPLGLMYSLPASRVHELRGKQHFICLTDQETIAIVRLAASIAAPDTALDYLRNIYIETMETRKKGHKVFKNLKHFILCSLTERDCIEKISVQKVQFQESSTDFNVEEWDQDIVQLTNDFNKVDYLNVYSQALIHSNLFDSNLSKNHLKLNNQLKFSLLSRRQMVDCRYKKPFICCYDIETGNKYIIIIMKKLRLIMNVFY